MNEKLPSSPELYLGKLREETQSLPEGEIKEFLQSYFDMREMVYTILQKIPEEKLNYKPANREEVHDLRECFAELPRVELSLIKGLQTGERKYGGGHNALPEKPTKTQILDSFERVDNELFDTITKPDFDPQKEVVWIGPKGQIKSKSKAIWMLWGLRNHENMHLGMVRRDLDAIGVEPSKEYTKYWYGS